MLQLYNESMKNDEDFQELNEKKNPKKPIYFGEKSPIEEKYEIPKIIGNKEKMNKKKLLYGEIQGNHNEFLKDKNEFDFKKFIESTDPEIKKTQKEKVKFISNHFFFNFIK